jgi:hypothetical protein
MALLHRSRLEGNKTRTVERGVLQIQALVDQITTWTPTDALIAERLAYFFIVPVPSRWELESELADRMMGLGVIKTALDIFERLEMWEKVVVCYMLVERKDKAEQLVLKLLDREPRNPRLLCLLGDIRTEPSLYEDAWEASNGRYSRAMRSLGPSLPMLTQFVVYMSSRKLTFILICTFQLHSITRGRNMRNRWNAG